MIYAERPASLRRAALLTLTILVLVATGCGAPMPRPTPSDHATEAQVGAAVQETVVVVNANATATAAAAVVAAAGHSATPVSIGEQRPGTTVPALALPTATGPALTPAGSTARVAPTSTPFPGPARPTIAATATMRPARPTLAPTRQPIATKPPAPTPTPGPLIVGGVTLARGTTSDGLPYLRDAGLPDEEVGDFANAVDELVRTIPAAAGFPPLRLPVTFVIMADVRRLREAQQVLAPSARSTTAVVDGLYIAGRRGRYVLIAAEGVRTSPSSLRMLLGHEIAHAASDEGLTGPAKLPLWAEEGYAEAVSLRALRAIDPGRADLNVAIETARLASASLVRPDDVIDWAAPAPDLRFTALTNADRGHLAYGQARRWVEYLLAQRGQAGFEELRRRLGAGEQEQTAVRAVYGDLPALAGRHADEERRVLEPLRGGLHQFSPGVVAGQPIFLTVVGGRPGEPVTARLHNRQVTSRPAQIGTVDDDGFYIVRIAGEWTATPIRFTATVSTPSLGSMTSELVVEAAP